MKKVLKVGFDLDGVILYNPIRFIRPIAKLFKPIKSLLLKQNLDSFYFPKSKLEQFLFRLLHKTSFKPDSALFNIKQLVKNKRIKAYIVTGRYGFLKSDYETWLKKINAKKIFEKCYQNTDDLQPNKFKEKMIKKLDLDIYIEDNWDIVEKLKIKNKKLKIFWITNILDKNIPYQYKFRDLKSALENIATS
ncbi:MAG: hypothetical protein WC741_03885 [Patescibacteria group bacterium]|jgi:hypothetical protein